ncbi:IS4 ORF [Shigella flexneri]|nr:IS4 ORF [Shigella flexneri]
MRNGDENADDIAGRFTGTYTGADARSCKYGTTCEITDEKGKSLPESGKGEALEIPHSPEKEPVSCLTDWHYPIDAQKTGKTTWFAKLRLKLNWDLASKGETMALYTIGEVALLCDINPVTLRA